MWGYPFSESPTDFGLDGTKPCVIGECPPLQATAISTSPQLMRTLTTMAGTGVFAWKTSGQDDGCGLWLDIQPAIEKMAGICEDKIFPKTEKDCYKQTLINNHKKSRLLRLFFVAPFCEQIVLSVDYSAA